MQIMFREQSSRSDDYANPRFPRKSFDKILQLSHAETKGPNRNPRSSGRYQLVFRSLYPNTLAVKRNIEYIYVQSNAVVESKVSNWTKYHFTACSSLLHSFPFSTPTKNINKKTSTVIILPPVRRKHGHRQRNQYWFQRDIVCSSD